MKGQIFLLTDENSAIQATFIPNSRVIAIEEPDDTEILKNSNEIVWGSLLLPPYSILCEYIEDNVPTYANEYMGYLYSSECVEFSLLIFKALYSGINIYLYIPEGLIDMTAQYIFRFFNDWGISIGIYNNSPFSYTQPVHAPIETELYMRDLLEPMDFLSNIPLGYVFSPVVISKLVNDINPYIPYPSYDNYAIYFSKYIEAIKTAGKPLGIPMMRFKAR